MLRLTQHGGNHFDNPGADARPYRTAPDEIGPAPEQPGWSWAGPSGSLGDRPVIGRSSVRIRPRAPFQELKAIKQDEQIWGEVGGGNLSPGTGAGAASGSLSGECAAASSGAFARG